MVKTKDNEINKILNRAEEYRKQLQIKKAYEEINKFDTEKVRNIFKSFFKGKTKSNYIKNNIYINYKLTKDELKNGCKKTIKYKGTDEKNKRISKEIEVKFPENIKEGQKIIISNCGNYLKEETNYSDLIITIFSKERRKNGKNLFFTNNV